MRMWSQGLGSIELVVDGQNMTVINNDGKTIVKGVTDEPVEWDFEVTLEKEDIPGILNLVFKYTLIKFLMKNIRYFFKASSKAQAEPDNVAGVKVK